MNYRNEINRLHKQIKVISEQIEKLMAEQDRMYEIYRGKLFISSNLRKAYEDLQNNVDRLDSIRCHIEDLIGMYESELKAANDGYFRIMDEIDIRDIIGRDGFIIAVKF